MQILFDQINIAIFVVAFLNTVLGLLVLIEQPRNPKNKYFFFFTVAATLWGVTMFLFRSTESVEVTTIIARLLYISAASIPLFFLYFIHHFDETKIHFPLAERVLLVVLFTVIGALAASPYFIETVIIPEVGEKVIVFQQLLHLAFGLYIMGVFSLGYFQLFSKIFSEKGVLRSHFKAITLGTLISGMIGMGTNLLLPYFGIFSLNWFGQVAVIVMVGFIFNSIVRFKLFNIKIITTEILAFSLWVFILIRILVSDDNTERVINSILLAVTLVIGILLIRSVKLEIDQKNVLQSLKDALQKSNGDLEIANEQLKGLDKLKTEFLSLASHQLRSPLTAIKGYSSMLIEDSFGKIDEHQREAVKRIYTSAQGLVSIVEDLLDVTKIEQGGMKYQFVDTDIKKLVTDLYNEMLIPAQNKNLKLTLDIQEEKDCVMSVDPTKLKQVFLNLVDNSIKYTKEGFVKIMLSKKNNNLHFVVQDSGLGVTAETKKRLFQKFSRGEAGKTNTGGSGLGLYIAQKIVEAHKGTISIESEGEGKGAMFIVEIPLSNPFA
jgi:signal transduction histidine kinase